MAIAELFTSTDCLLWREALAKYSDVLERKVAEKSTKKSKGTDLIQLDKWLGTNSVVGFMSSDTCHLTLVVWQGALYPT